MAWTGATPTSRIFVQAMLNPLLGRSWTTAAPTTFANLSADVINVALFGNSVTPDASAAVASTGFNTGTWTTGNEVIDATNWPSGGLALASKTFSVLTAGSATTPAEVNFDGADRAGTGNVTIAAAFGAFVYDNTITAGTVAKQGLCFNYFGGTQSVTAGTFTVIWDVTGILKVSV